MKKFFAGGALALFAFAGVGIVVPAMAQALPACKIIPGPACDRTKPIDRSLSPQGPKQHTSGKKNVNDGKTPAIRFR